MAIRTAEGQVLDEMVELEKLLIDSAHPLNTGRYDLFDDALRLVGERRSKYDLVDLVNWLLSRIDTQQKAKQDQVKQEAMDGIK